MCVCVWRWSRGAGPGACRGLQRGWGSGSEPALLSLPLLLLLHGSLPRPPALQEQIEKVRKPEEQIGRMGVPEQHVDSGHAFHTYTLTSADGSGESAQQGPGRGSECCAAKRPAAAPLLCCAVPEPACLC